MSLVVSAIAALTVIKKLSVRASISCFEYYYAIDLGKGVLSVKRAASHVHFRNIQEQCDLLLITKKYAGKRGRLAVLAAMFTIKRRKTEENC